MTAAANPITRGTQPLPRVHIEDSDFCKVVCSIPFIGGVFAIAREYNIHNIIHGTNDVPTLIALIRVKNEQQLQNIKRSVVDTALIVSGIALGVFDMSSAWLPGVYFSLIATEVYMIRHNTQVQMKLQETGSLRFKPQIS